MWNAAKAADAHDARNAHKERLWSGASCWLGPVLAAALSVAVPGCGASSSERSHEPVLAVPNPPAVDAAIVTIGTERLEVDVARSDAAQRLGLGRYRSLPWDRGMIFPYPQPAFHAFWMKGMHFDIDIVWIRDGRIIGIAPRVPAPLRPDAENPARVQSSELVDLVLEVPAGYASAHGWRRGDRVAVSGAP